MLEILHKILQTNGHWISYGWSIVFSLISCVCKEEIVFAAKSLSILLKVSFQCVQLIATDFLSSLPITSLIECVSALYFFAIQKEDLNIGLSSVGLMWNVSDYVRKYNCRDEEEKNSFDELWISLLSNLKKISTDPRSEIRNSALQTLFRTVTANINGISMLSWKHILDDLLFPLLQEMNSIKVGDEIAQQQLIESFSASSADKQINESRILLINNTAKLFHDFLAVLYKIDSFVEYWKKYLNFLQSCATLFTTEVTMASLKSLKLILSVEEEKKREIGSLYWLEGWNCWIALGRTCKNYKHINQECLVAYISIFKVLYPAIKSDFTLSFLDQFSCIIKDVLLIQSDGVANDSEICTSLQLTTLEVIDSIDTLLDHFNSHILELSSFLMTLAYEKNPQRKHSYIALSKVLMPKILKMLSEKCSDSLIFTDFVYCKVLRAYGIPIGLKYATPRINDTSLSLWKLATTTFYSIIDATLNSLDALRDNSQVFNEGWSAIVDVIDAAISAEVPSNLPLDEMENDELFDLDILEFIWTSLIAKSENVPFIIIERLVNSIVKVSTIPGDAAEVLREKFIFSCLEFLFKLCSVSMVSGSVARERVAIRTYPILMQKCVTVLKKYSNEKPLYGKYPIPRVRQEEVIAVLKLICNLELLCKNEEEPNSLEFLKKGKHAHLFHLYPYLCECLKCEDVTVIPIIYNFLCTFGSALGLCEEQ